MFYYVTSPPLNQLIHYTLKSILQSLASLFVGGLWETFWVHALDKPYAWLSKHQYITQEKLAEVDMANRWTVYSLHWACLLGRAFMRNWATGKWVAVIALAAMQTENGESMISNYKIVLGSIFYMVIIPHLYFKLKKLRRQHAGCATGNFFFCF